MNYTELDVWKHSRELVKLVYTLTRSFPREELYSLTNQLRRCVISVPSNIAEGVGRQSNKETIHFLYIAKGSLQEVETQLYLSFDLDYIVEEELKNILVKVISNKKLLNGFINYYKKLRDEYE
ncbi:four helix bundle protein [Flavivirga aquatica]|uniref:Four helix bundle protein n=1 Tax=Flavivirga aquatica TaxID=1849968 RepID=A0A1E5T9E2_9FLAO|nr:four helix bundle protein [Flavivirga aquatica]OEK07984.1 four helix bundle protein [Flavivirga aquatica]